MKEEIMDHINNLKEQGINVRVDEDQINDLINRIFDKKDKKNTYIDPEIDKFLKDYGDKNIYINMIKIKINLIQKELLNHLKNYIIN